VLEKSIRLTNNKEKSTDFNEFDLLNAPDAFFESIYVLDMLEKSDNKNLLDAVCKKIRKGGSLKLDGIDALNICRSVYHGQLSLSQAADAFFREVKSLHSIVSLKEYFIDKGWEVIFIGLNDGRYLVEVTRA